ncbi:MAG: transglutaminase domain-containing protein [Myxococcota bacterium]|nr:transglutaminase domain-containing protein [Myxococcota bacterium]
MPRRGPRRLLLLLSLTLPVPPSAAAPPAALAATRPPLHEPITDGPAALAAPPATLPQPRLLPPAGSAPPDELPAAILREGLGLLPPVEPSRPGAEELPYRAGEGGAAAPLPAAPDPRPARPATARLDRMTGPDGRLIYHEVFNPAIAPFKRDAAFDTVLPDESLAVGGAGEDGLRETPPLGPQLPDGWEPFWGSLVVELAGSAAAPLPSVAADARILGYRSTPPLALRFFKDRADNFWVRPHVPHDGAIRLVFLTAAPATAFGGPIPDFALADVPPALRPRVPEPVLGRARELLRGAGLAALRSRPPREALLQLVAFFRDFSAGPPPPASAAGSLLLDLGLARRGVCRHRAQIFVIVAQSLGLAARYVHNEAHAFTEVFLPGQGWRRIDLGGASDELQVLNTLGKIPHQPPLADPFPWPRPALAAGSSPGSTAGAAGGAGAGPGDTLLEVSASTALPDWRIVLQRVSRRAYRGEEIDVRGLVLTRDEAPVPGADIAVVLREGFAGSPLRVLGMLVSDAQGGFAGSLPLPADLPPGDYEVNALDARRLGTP